jgi:hypothetical protein
MLSGYARNKIEMNAIKLGDLLLSTNSRWVGGDHNSYIPVGKVKCSIVVELEFIQEMDTSINQLVDSVYVRWGNYSLKTGKTGKIMPRFSKFKSTDTRNIYRKTS